MSAYKELKHDFIERLSKSLADIDTDLAYHKQLVDGDVPNRLMKKWVGKFYQRTIPALSETPRLVNHFKLGADPEFVFMTGNDVVAATALGLKAGLCVGADNNGRLAELRPKPSKSALKVVASMYAEFCFLAQYDPGITKYNWFASPFAGRDGLGGHIHFGRWRPLRKMEVAALDALMHLLQYAGCINDGAQKARLGTNLYGRFGDIRPQLHGYEYRTFPTWVGCPRHAHLYLTLAKLAVHNPTLFNDPRHVRMTKYLRTEAQNLIRNALFYYQHIDDDAKLALCYLERCWTPPNGNIQKAWNIQPILAPIDTKRHVILPPVIAPKPVHIKAMFNYLTAGIRDTVVEPFEMLTFPAEYTPVQTLIITERQPELGELFWDVAMLPVSEQYNAIRTHAAPDMSMRVSSAVREYMKAGLKGNGFSLPDGTFCQVNDVGTGGFYLSLPNWLISKQHQGWLKKFLTEEGLFPFVRLGQEPVSREWKRVVKEKLLLHA